MNKDCLFAQTLGATDFSFAELFFLAKKSEKRILKEYKPKDELWAIAKYYAKRYNDKTYKGFVVYTIIEGKDAKQLQTPTPPQFNDAYLPF